MREKQRSRGDRALCPGKAKVINMLVWAHQCHLLGGKRLSGEFAFVSHRLLASVFGEGRNGEWGAVGPDLAFVRGCRYQDVVCCHLSPPFEMADSASLVEIEPDNEIAREKSKGPRRSSAGRGCPGWVSVPGEVQLSRDAKPGAWGCQQPWQSPTCCSVA